MADRYAASKPLHPNKLRFGIGGYTGESFEVHWTGDALEYRVYDPGFELRIVRLVNPAPHDWKIFWQWLDEHDLWSWPQTYASETPLQDGTSWSVQIEAGDRKLASAGANPYPHSRSDRQPPVFKGFLAALRRLLGGLELG
ncbi:MAG: hypothetical protein WD314_05940 [Trueperaceae bacterium]